MKLPDLSEQAWAFLSLFEKPGASEFIIPAKAGWGRVEFQAVSGSLKPYLQPRENGVCLSAEGKQILKTRRDLLNPATLGERLTAISTGLQRVLDSGLNRRAVIALLHDSTRLPKGEIETFLDGLSALEKNYCK